MWIVVGAVVFYFVWKKFLQKPAVKVDNNTNPVLVPSEEVTQGDMVNNLSLAKGY